jgi:hypothetical protein
MKNTENAAVILPIKKMLEKAHPNFRKHCKKLNAYEDCDKIRKN